MNRLAGALRFKADQNRSNRKYNLKVRQPNMSQDIQRFDSGRRMSKAVVHGDTVYLCGQVGVRGTSIEDQTQEALNRVQTLLESVGSNKSKMLQVIIWLKSMDDFDAMNRIWEAWLPEGMAPARACAQSALASDELLVEFTVTAAI